MKLVHEERQFSKNGLAGDLALSSLLDLEDRLLNYARKQVDMKITKEDMVKIRSATHCHICETKFEETDKKCKDHVSRLPLNLHFFYFDATYFCRIILVVNFWGWHIHGAMF